MTTSTLTIWLLVMRTLIYNQDDGRFHQSYFVRDKGFSTLEECNAAKFQRLHGDTIDPALEIDCVEAHFEPTP